ncbi:MAG TPA: glycosyltransferase family 2 protein [Chloroflexota bacterium]|nr:glycosyltransferase family 2 protein [Chloroflexota bacterium]
MPNVGIEFEWSSVAGYFMLVLISIIGIRLLFYFDSFFYHWSRYRRLERITLDDIRALPWIPFVKIQITTRGTLGSTKVIKRGIDNVLALVGQAPDLYGPLFSIEVITESPEQKKILEEEYGSSQIAFDAVVLPGEYATPKGTKLKARALHYMVELRRQGFNRKPGRTFIVHYDEESVMEPDELRKLLHYLARTDKKMTEGPIYYPLEYGLASPICQAMEANRPVGCFECREVMETGTPLHLHGSNLVVEEELENDLGWDIGLLDSEPFIAEDFVFGVLAFLKEGPGIFGWHGSVMLEQPPFSLKSAFRQRYRWVIGTLQGIAMMQRRPEFRKLPRGTRNQIIWGTRYRVLTFALGLPTGMTSLLYLIYQAWLLVSGRSFLPLPAPFMVWLVVVGFLWLNSLLVGSWYNLCESRSLSFAQRWIDGAHVLTVAPIAGVLESTAAFWAVLNWILQNRTVSWQPTPKTREADASVNRGAAT